MITLKGHSTVYENRLIYYTGPENSPLQLKVTKGALCNIMGSFPDPEIGCMDTKTVKLNCLTLGELENQLIFTKNIVNINNVLM